MLNLDTDSDPQLKDIGLNTHLCENKNHFWLVYSQKSQVKMHNQLSAGLFKIKETRAS